MACCDHRYSKSVSELGGWRGGTCLFSRCQWLQAEFHRGCTTCYPPEDCAPQTCPLPNKIVLPKMVLKTKRKKGEQKPPVTVKGFQHSYIRNVRAGVFHRSKMQSSALVVLAPGPAETWGDQELLPQGQATELWAVPPLWEQNHLLSPTSHTGCNTMT